MSKRSAKVTKKSLEAARRAGAQYARDQVQGTYFEDWARDQLVEAEEMRRRDPSSVLPLESPADFRKLARNMLQQLRWDIERELDPRTVIGEDASREEQEAFWEGLRGELTDPNIVHHVVDDLMRAHEDVRDAQHERSEPPPQLPLPGVHDRRHVRSVARSNVPFAVYTADGNELTNGISEIEAMRFAQRAANERGEVVEVYQGSKLIKTVRPIKASGRTVQDYVAVDTRNRVVAGPFKDYGEAKREADRAGGVVKFVMDRGPSRQVREDPRDFGYDPDIRSGPRNFPRLRRLPPESR